MTHQIVRGFMLLGVITLLTNCTEDQNDNGTELMGQVQFELTDAPIDDAAVQACFVTVSDLMIDGESISSFEGTQTIDLLAYQNGQVESLGIADVKAGTYSNITLVLDYETDASGNSPGCYVQTTDNAKHSLSTSANLSNMLTLNSGDFEVQEGMMTNVVLDFDVRKAVKRQDDGPSDQYEFVTRSEIESAIRFVDKNETAMMEGECNDNMNMTSKIVVYAYKTGTFDLNTETSGQGTSQIMFKNAVSSAVVNSQGNYTLAFLEAGDYELHFFGYDDMDNDGQMELQGELELSLLGNLGLNLNSIKVDAGVDLNINVNIIGILPL